MALACEPLALGSGELHETGNEKLSALRILAPRIVDADKGHANLGHFSFDDEKNEAKRILMR